VWGACCGVAFLQHRRFKRHAWSVLHMFLPQDISAACCCKNHFLLLRLHVQVSSMSNATKRCAGL
jgi:hypothetical protein